MKDKKRRSDWSGKIDITHKQINPMWVVVECGADYHSKIKSSLEWEKVNCHICHKKRVLREEKDMRDADKCL